MATKVVETWTTTISEWDCEACGQRGTVREETDFAAAATFALNLWRRGDWDDESIVSVASGDERRSFEVHWSGRIRDWCLNAVDPE